MTGREFIRRFWPLAALVLLTAAAYFAGRASVPAPEVQVQERVEYRDRVVERVVAVHAAETQRAETRRRTVERIHPDGTLEHEVEVSEVGEVSVRIVQSEAARLELREGQIEREVTVKPAMSDWRLSAIAAVDVHRIRLAAPADALLVGVSVERRLVGPLSAGAMALLPVSQPLAPVVGVSLSLEW